MLKMSKIKTLFVFQVFLLIVLTTLINAQPNTNIRATYINLFDNGNLIPQAFLNRAANNGYSHVLVELYVWQIAGTNEWVAGRYNRGVFDAGTLFNRIRTCFEQIEAAGMRMIPVIQIGAPDAHWVNTGIPANECYPRTVTGNNQSLNYVVSSIAPGGVRALAFQDAMRVVRAAFDNANWTNPNPPQDIEFINLGYSEAFENWGDNPLRQFYGTSQPDINWMSANTGNRVDLVAASIQEKIGIIQGVGGPLANTRVIVYGDLYEPECWTNTSNPLIDLPRNIANLGIANEVIFMQWWYQTTARDGSDYDCQAAIQHLTNNGSDAMIMCSIADDNQINQVADHYRQLGEAVTVLGLSTLRNRVIGYAAGHWDITGYDNDIGWRTMEFLSAYARYNAAIFY